MGKSAVAASAGVVKLPVHPVLATVFREYLVAFSFTAQCKVELLYWIMCATSWIRSVEAEA